MSSVAYPVPIGLPRKRRIISPSEWLREKVKEQQAERDATISKASVTSILADTSTLNQTTYATQSACVPVTGDWLLATFCSSGTPNPPTSTLTDSSGQTWTRLDWFTWESTSSFMEIFVCDAAATNASRTLTFTVSTAGTGSNINVISVQGMSTYGTSSVRQRNGVDNQGAVAMATTFASAALTGNITIDMYGKTLGVNLTAPAGWTTVISNSWVTPAEASGIAYRLSGFTGTTITWGSANGGTGCACAIELNTPAAGAAGPRNPIKVARQAVARAASR